MAGFEVTLHGRIWVTPEVQAEGLGFLFSFKFALLLVVNRVSTVILAVWCLSL
jgi:hypothetical protein